MAARCEPSAEEIEHAAGAEGAKGIDRLTFDVLGQHGCRGLADDAARTSEPRLFDDASGIDSQFQLDAIAAHRIVHTVTMSGVRKRSPMIRLFVMPHHVFVVQPLFVVD